MAKKKVFIVHGHDELAKEQTENLIHRLGMEPIVLHRRPDKFRILIDKLEQEGRFADYALVLVTPDDEGRSKKETTLRPRARQNVLFEYGYFMGKLGRDKVILLVKGDVDFPSDFGGIIYKKFTSSVFELESDLRQEFEAVKPKPQFGLRGGPPIGLSAPEILPKIDFPKLPEFKDLVGEELKKKLGTPIETEAERRQRMARSWVKRKLTEPD